MIITIDGPSAAGKGTLARRLAEELGFGHLDTGALYRGVALALIKDGRPPTPENAAQAAANLDLTLLKDAALRAEETGRLASKISALPKVRRALLAFQLEFAKGTPGVVLDGRDTGTVVCPEAEVKFFVTASVDERARRRLAELSARDIPANEDQIRDDIEARDARDRSRDISPLIPAEDAHLLDTTNLDIEAAFQRALKIIQAELG